MPIKPRNEAHAFEMLLTDCQHTFDRIAPGFGDVSFRIYDGEDWVHAAPVPDSAALVASANSTGEDILAVYGPGGGHSLATFELIYGNAPDGSELISDCSEGAFANAVFERFTSRFSN